MTIAKRSTVAALAAAVLVLAGAAAPASATTAVSGSRVCPAGQTLRIILTTEGYSTVNFYLSGNLRGGSTGYDHYFNYQVRGGNWRATTTGNILTQRENCTAATFAEVAQY